MAAETILLTGGSGFIAAHILEDLLAKGRTVVTTVRSQAKADAINAAHPDLVASKPRRQPVGRPTHGLALPLQVHRPEDGAHRSGHQWHDGHPTRHQEARAQRATRRRHLVLCRHPQRRQDA
ncbi:hypothetical protein NLG97_g10037 [Lecanicillium saksenae]|uniref:Uncharacterized protein n=1 Tax=Lecanicillium saksenae TaxID=468837 RepID=A0ACC1QHJ7_9HYPO|nr:hypothetical protein NLG97_g10037 [Lecanicillium saksenae]